MPGTVIFNNARVFLTTSTDDISAFVRSVRLTRNFDTPEDTVMGMTAKSRAAGLEEWSAELNLLQDFTSTGAGALLVGIDKLLAAKVGQKFVVAIRPVNAARTSDNPEYIGNVILGSYTPMDGAVGDVLQTRVPLLSAGSLTRSVSTS